MALPSMPSHVAVTVAEPAAWAVTNPEVLTVATFASDEAQVNVLPRIAFLFASRAVAVSCTVSPREAIVLVAGVTATDATVGGVGSVVPSPQATRAEPAINVRD